MCETSEPPFAGKREMVESEREDVPVSRACELVNVCRSGLYRARQPRRNRDAQVRAAMDPIVEHFAGYGYRRVTEALARQGFVVNHKRVLRMMRQNGWLCRLRSRMSSSSSPRSWTLTRDECWAGNWDAGWTPG